MRINNTTTLDSTRASNISTSKLLFLLILCVLYNPLLFAEDNTTSKQATAKEQTTKAQTKKQATSKQATQEATPLIRHAGVPYSEERIRDYLSRYRLVLDEKRSTKTRKKDATAEYYRYSDDVYSKAVIKECHTMLTALQTLQFAFIQPDTRTDDWHDPALLPYKETYPGLLKEGMGQVPWNDPQGNPQIFYPSWNIQLYLIDVDGDDNGEIEAVLYGERILLRGEFYRGNHGPSPGYHVFEKKPLYRHGKMHLRHTGAHLQHDPSSLAPYRKTNDHIFTAIIRVQGVYAVLAIYDGGEVGASRRFAGRPTDIFAEVQLLNRHYKVQPMVRHSEDPKKDPVIRSPHRCYYDFERMQAIPDPITEITTPDPTTKTTTD